MKTLFLLAVVFLTGCANFDADKFSKALNESLQQYQQNQQIIQSMQPYTIPQQKINSTEFKSGLTWVLKGNSVNGTIRYCTYANGEIISIHISKWCENTIIR